MFNEKNFNSLEDQNKQPEEVKGSFDIPKKEYLEKYGPGNPELSEKEFLERYSLENVNKKNLESDIESDTRTKEAEQKLAEELVEEKVKINSAEIPKKGITVEEIDIEIAKRYFGHETVGAEGLGTEALKKLKTVTNVEEELREEIKKEDRIEDKNKLTKKGVRIDWLEKGIKDIRKGGIPSSVTKKLEGFLIKKGISEDEFKKMTPRKAWNRAASLYYQEVPYFEKDVEMTPKDIPKPMSKETIEEETINESSEEQKEEEELREEIKKEDRIEDKNKLTEKEEEERRVEEAEEIIKQGEQEQLFELGRKIKVKRTSGEFEDGWKIFGSDPDIDEKVIVYKKEGDKILSKSVNIDKLKSWQEEPKIEEAIVEKEKETPKAEQSKLEELRKEGEKRAKWLVEKSAFLFVPEKIMLLAAKSSKELAIKGGKWLEILGVSPLAAIEEKSKKVLAEIIEEIQGKKQENIQIKIERLERKNKKLEKSIENARKRAESKGLFVNWLSWLKYDE